MPDLQPNTALLQPQQQAGGLGQMSLGDLLNIAGKGRSLATQSAISDALKQSNGDPAAARQLLLNNPNATIGSDDLAHMTQLEQQQFELHKGYMGEAAGAIGSLFTHPNPTIKDWTPIEHILASYGVPQEYLDLVRNSARGPGGTLDHDKLVTVRNWISQNAGVAEKTIPGAGTDTTVPAGRAQYNKPLPGGQQQAIPTPAPRPSTGGGSAQQQKSDPAIEAAQEVNQQYAKTYQSGGGIVTGPNATQQTKLADSAKQHAALSSRDYPSDTIPMEKSIELLVKNPNLTGRGLDEVNNVKNFLHSFGFIPDKDMKDVVDYETLKKYMVQFVNQNTMGGTDARLWEGIAGSPSPDKLGETNLNVMRVGLGLRRMQQAGLNEYRRIGGQPEYFQDWLNSWAQKQDPMAYVWNTMTDKEKKAYGDSHFTGKSPAVWQKFESSLNTAEGSLH